MLYSEIKVTTAQPSDQDLVSRANAGDTEAFEEIYRVHRQWVVALAHRFTGSREDALDVMQESFAELFRRFPGFRLSSSLRAFLYPVIKHRAISLGRKRRKTVNIDELRGHGWDAAAGIAWQPETPGDFDRLISTLPGGQQEVIRLRFAFDMQLGEIAEALGIPVGTVKSRLHNAIKALRQESLDFE